MLGEAEQCLSQTSNASRGNAHFHRKIDSLAFFVISEYVRL